MPGIHIHLAIAKQYLKKHPEIKNISSFYKGNVNADFCKDKNKSHYTIVTPREDLVDYLQNKVHIYPFLQATSLNTDYEKGMFLHLITDKKFYTEFLDKEYLLTTTYSDYINDLYYSYEINNPKIIKKYHLSIERWNKKIRKSITKAKKEKGIIEKKKTNILDMEKLSNFIAETASLDLEKERKKYQSQKGE